MCHMPQADDWTNIPLAVRLLYLIIIYTFYCREDEDVFVSDNILDLVRLLITVNKVFNPRRKNIPWKAKKQMFGRYLK